MRWECSPEVARQWRFQVRSEGRGKTTVMECGCRQAGTPC